MTPASSLLVIAAGIAMLAVTRRSRRLTATCDRVPWVLRKMTSMTLEDYRQHNARAERLNVLFGVAIIVLGFGALVASIT